MSTSSPFEPHLGLPDEGIPAADAGQGAPPPAEGFGVSGEEPDRPEQTDGGPADASAPEDPPFRTPDPEDVQRP